MDPPRALFTVVQVIDYIVSKAKQVKTNKEGVMRIAKYLVSIESNLNRLETHLSSLMTKATHDLILNFHSVLIDAKNLIDNIDNPVIARKLQAGSASNSESSQSISASAFADANSEHILKIERDILFHGFFLNTEITVSLLKSHNVSELDNSGSSKIPYDFYPNESNALISSDDLSKTFRIKYRSNEEVFCLKVITKEGNTFAFNNIIKEVNILRSLKHESVGTYINTCIHPQQHELHVLMEYIEGRPLSEMIGRAPFIFKEKSPTYNPTTTTTENVHRHERLRLWMVQLCESLAHMHAAGINHRNLRPENVIMDIESQHLKIVDICIFSKEFNVYNGMSKFQRIMKNKSLKSQCTHARDSSHIFDMSIIEKCAYMSPERMSCSFSPYEITSEVDSKDDMWALGCIFAELILGRRFLGELASDPPIYLDDFLPIIRDGNVLKGALEAVVRRSANIGSVVVKLLATKQSLRLSAYDVLQAPELIDQNMKDFVFRIGSSSKCYSMIRLNIGELPPISLDCIYVLSVPLKGYEKGYQMMSSKFTHSVVILLNQQSGAGYMLEYNDSNTVQLSPCRLANRVAVNVKVRPYQAFQQFEGFYSCQVDIQKLIQINKVFEQYSEYHVHKHNCHVYHRTIVATILLCKQDVLYSLRTRRALANLMFTSNSWISLIKGNKFAEIRTDIETLDFATILNKNCLLDSDFIKTIDYDSRKHIIVQEINMNLPLDNFVKKQEKIQHEKEEKTVTQKKLRQCLDSNHNDLAKLRYALQESLHLGDFCSEVAEMKEIEATLVFVQRENLQQAIEEQNLYKLKHTIKKSLSLGQFDPVMVRAKGIETDMEQIKQDIENGIYCFGAANAIKIVFEKSENAKYLLHPGDHVVLLDRTASNDFIAFINRFHFRKGVITDYIPQNSFIPDRGLFTVDVQWFNWYTSESTQVLSTNLRLIPRYVDHERVFDPIVRDAKLLLIDEKSCSWNWIHHKLGISISSLLLLLLVLIIAVVAVSY